jgi:polysaccharide biosynthesis protein PslH
MNLLFTTPVLEHPAAGGPQLRIENSILALNRVSELFIVSRIEKNMIGGEEAEQYFRSNCREFTYAPTVKWLSSNHYFRIFQRLFKKIFQINDADFILDYVAKHQIDVIWFGYGNISYDLIQQIKTKQPGISVVCDTDSVWSRFVLRELPYENDPERRKQIEEKGTLKEKEEHDWVNLCDVTTAVSEVDADYYRELATDKEKVKIFSNAINLDTYSYSVPQPLDFKKPCMYLAGTFWPKSPMEKATRWIIDEVLPQVRKKIPSIHFYIVGNGSGETLNDICSSAITITGKLPSVLPYLCNADVSIVPLTFESGTRFKILEAGACGIPIVSTTLGAEGIPITNGKDILIADTPDDFAQAIIRVIQDRHLAESLGLNLKELVIRDYSIDALAGEGQKIINYLFKDSK